MPASVPSSLPRRIALVVAAMFAIVFGLQIGDRLFAGGLSAPLDFTAFWTAGRIGIEGGNVYDGAAVHDVQRGLGLNDTAIMMWNPPWTLTLVMPLGLLPFRMAYGAWALLHILLMLASAELFWCGLGGLGGGLRLGGKGRPQGLNPLSFCWRGEAQG